MEANARAKSRGGLAAAAAETGAWRAAWPDETPLCTEMGAVIETGGLLSTRDLTDPPCLAVKVFGGVGNVFVGAAPT